MAVNYDGLVFKVLENLTVYVFGKVELTSLFLMLLLFLFAVFIRIPIPFAFALPIPLAIVLMAYGFLSVTVGAFLIVPFLILAILSALAGLNVD